MRRFGLVRAGLWTALAVFALLGGGVPTVFAQTAEETAFEFTFDNDAQGWETGFADLPADFDQEIFELESGFRPLPEGLEGNGVFLQGHNPSDDLFMYLTRQVTGLRPDTTYSVTVDVDLATNVPAGSFGIGGSPGESVYVKAGATPVEPAVAEDSGGWLRISVDKGNQASEGTQMLNLGNVASPEVVGDEYKIKTLDNRGRRLEVATDGQGQVWLIVGTDSGFEGLSAFYYARVDYAFEAVELPNAGDVVPSSRAMVEVAVLGAILAGLGSLVLVRRRRHQIRQ